MIYYFCVAECNHTSLNYLVTMSFRTVVLRGNFTEESARNQISSYCVTSEDKLSACKLLTSELDPKGLRSFAFVVSDSLYRKLLTAAESVREDRRHRWFISEFESYFETVSQGGLNFKVFGDSVRDAVDYVDEVLKSLSEIGAVPERYQIATLPSNDHYEGLRDYFFVNFSRPLTDDEFGRCLALLRKKNFLACSPAKNQPLIEPRKPQKSQEPEKKVLLKNAFSLLDESSC